MEPAVHRGDGRVEVASRLAEVLSPVREKSGVKSISVSGDWREMTIPKLEVTLQDGNRVFWGSPPGHESPGEQTAEMKLHRLLQGNLPRNADLRMAQRPR